MTAKKKQTGALPKQVVPKRPVRHAVAVDEARERAEGPPQALRPRGGVGEELGRAFLEEATGADDAATEHRAAVTPEEVGGPFIITSGATEFAPGTDASNPGDATREAVPTASKPRP